MNSDNKYNIVTIELDVGFQINNKLSKQTHKSFDNIKTKDLLDENIIIEFCMQN